MVTDGHTDGLPDGKTDRQTGNNIRSFFYTFLFPSFVRVPKIGFDPVYFQVISQMYYPPPEYNTAVCSERALSPHVTNLKKLR